MNQDYETENMSDSARKQLVNIHAAEMEMYRLQQRLAMIKTAHNAYKAALTKEIAGMDVEVSN